MVDFCGTRVPIWLRFLCTTIYHFEQNSHQVSTSISTCKPPSHKPTPTPPAYMCLQTCWRVFIVISDQGVGGGRERVNAQDGSSHGQKCGAKSEPEVFFCATEHVILRYIWMEYVWQVSRCLGKCWGVWQPHSGISEQYSF